MTALPVNQLFICLYNNFNFTELESTYFSLLSEPETERFHRIKHRDTQKQYFLTRVLLRRQLSQITSQPADALEFQTSDHGRPSLIGFDGDFNVSHTKNLIAIAIHSTDRVGVDVENTGRNGQYSDIAEHYFHDTECKKIGDDANAFFEIWTLKEAYIKALGLGLQKPLKSFYFDLNRSKKITLIDVKKEAFCQFKKPYINGFSHQFLEYFQLAWIQFGHQQPTQLPILFTVDAQLNTTPTNIDLTQVQTLSQYGVS